MNILHLSASPRGDQGDSHQLSSCIVEQLLARHPGAGVTRRALAGGALAHVDGDYARVLASASDETGGHGSLGCSERLIEELACADVLVIGTPMYNLTVPSTLKSWIDHVVRIHRTMRRTPGGKVGTLPDRPVYIAIASGSWRTGERARQPDFLEPYLRAVLPMIGLKDITVFTVEGLGLGPEQAAASRTQARAAVERFFAVQQAA
ncbi:FMN-dependent NADH-azoreductase [Massilia niastensis]|uniref:FMN-dependent NADH-azoreductase n=1 Tax=Massilia niastensis TaxID=544911 RepID=UPI0003662568|nr:NAD(P)H-dependent oxidoreductase [Massilia niastensis]